MVSGPKQKFDPVKFIVIENLIAFVFMFSFFIILKKLTFNKNYKHVSKLSKCLLICFNYLFPFLLTFFFIKFNCVNFLLLLKQVEGKDFRLWYRSFVRNLFSF